jgi:hypothetical protein
MIQQRRKFTIKAMGNKQARAMLEQISFTLFLRNGCGLGACGIANITAKHHGNTYLGDNTAKGLTQTFQ